MPKKHALLIANTEYRDGKLSSLAHPGLAYAELADALKDPARGAFSQVETLVNSNLSHVLNTLDRFFSRKPVDDILLVYVGAHGFIDAQGELFLALKESDRLRLKSTALMAAVLGMNMDQCPSPHKLLVLDCRFHSPFQDSRGGGVPKVDPAKVFVGRGLPKLILSAAEPSATPPKPPAAPAPTSSTQKIQVIAPKELTRVLAETFRTPSALSQTGGRNAFTVEDWWNDAAAEIRASKAEPPTLHTVGEPPPTVLRGASLPRPELAFTASTGETSHLMPAMQAEPEAEWSRLSGIFPLEMFAPDMAPKPGVVAPPADRASETEDRSDDPTARTMSMPIRRGDETIIAGPGYLEGADLVIRARREIESGEAAGEPLSMEALTSSPTLEVPLMEPPSASPGASRPGTPEAPPDPVRRPDATLFYDLRLPPASNPRDTFTDLRARLKAQEEEEKAARLNAEREEDAQREKLDLWKARWDTRKGKPLGSPTAPTETASDSKAPAADKPAAGSAPNGKPKPGDYQKKIAALQKTMYVPGPDVDPSGETQPLPTESPTTAPDPVRDGLATVIVSKDQFLNTGTHKALTELTPGATMRVSRNEFLSDLEAHAASPAAGGTKTMDGSATRGPSGPARPVRPGGDRRTGAHPKLPRRPGSGSSRKVLLYVLAGMLPVGLGLFLYFGAQAGLFSALGIGGDSRTPAPGAALPRNPEVTPPRPEAPASPVVATDPALPTQGLPPQGEQTVRPVPGINHVAPAPGPAPYSAAPNARAAVPAAAVPPATAPVARPTAPAARLAKRGADSLRRAQAAFRRDSLTAVQMALDAEKSARARMRIDSLAVARRSKDSLLTVRAQAKQDSLVQARLLRDYEKSKKAEVDAARFAVERTQKDSLKAIADAAASEGLLRKSVNQALRADADEMKGLYNRFALGYPGLKGEVVVNLLVAPSGEIEKGTVHSSTTGIGMFDQLVLGNVMEWKIRPFKSKEPKAILVGLTFPPGSPQ